MSKNINNAITATTRVANGQDLQDLFAKYTNVSIRKLAQAADVAYGILLKASKAPVVGKPYDPEVTNWDAIANELAKRNKNFLEGGIIDWETLNQGPNRQGTALVKDTAEFTVGKLVYLRKNNETPYEIIYTTDTHVVIKLQGTSEPIAWSWSTFMINGPVFQPRANKVTAAVEA